MNKIKNNKIKFFTVALSICLSQSMMAGNSDLTQYVRPNIGTVHSRWFFYTPAALPFGMAKLGASTNGTYGNEQGWEAVGYDDTHTSIDGFPCLHEFQIGGILLMPVTGSVKNIPGKLDSPDKGWRSRFDKKDEHATAGYYSVVLKDYRIKVELTATERVGFQRYTFPESDSAHVIFDIGNRLGESGNVRDAYIRKVDEHTLEGYVVTEPEYVKKYQTGATVSMFFYAKVNKSPVSVSVLYRGGKISGGTEIKGAGAMMVLDYKTHEREKVDFKIGLSYTSIENARLNLEKETSGMTFEKARTLAKNKWNEALSRIVVSGGTQENKIKFYTGLYHVLLGRGLASDVNGSYPTNSGEMGQIELNSDGTPKFNHYNTDAIWGGYWNLTNLWAMAYPEYYNDWIQSQMLVYRDVGWLGDGIAASRYVSGVGTNMVSIAFSGAYCSGIRDFDVASAYKAALKNELEWHGRLEGAGKMDVRQFVEKGYVPYNDEIYFGTSDKGSAFSASHTLEYSFSSYAVAQWAKALGKIDDYKKLMDLSNGWTKLFDDTMKVIRPRMADGRFIEKFNPLEPWRGFQEGNAIQYTFFVPQDPVGLIRRVGKDLFNLRLDSIFVEARKSVFGGGKVAYAFSGLQSPYNHGNQPNLHISWLFNYSGKPYLTQKLTRLICDEFYGVTGEHGYGYGQDEDQGQLGAWFVLSSMGLFDVQGGACYNPTFQIGSPMFDRIEIKLNSKYAKGKTFVIETENNGKDSYYVQSAELNGKPLDNCWLYRRDFFKGGVLKLKMGQTPNYKWGISDVPYYGK